MLATVVVADDGLQEPPQVLAAVQSALSEFSQYTDYQGPTGTASAAAQTSKPKPKIEVNVAAAACAPYWMETINHQGIAAFNSNPTGYKVFRNVKDYGAKGCPPPLLPKLNIAEADALFSQVMVSRTIQQPFKLQSMMEIAALLAPVRLLPSRQL